MPKPGTKQESPIAASATAKAILRRLSAQLKVRKIDLLDHALHALEAHVAHHGGRLLLPLRFNETFSITAIDPSRPMILPDPLHEHELEATLAEGADRIRKPARSRAARG